MTDHEKRIRALLDYHANSQCELVAADKADLRALLADLDGMRGALKSVQAAIYMDDAGQLRLTRSFDESTINYALKGAAHEPEPQDDNDNEDPWLSGDDMMGASG